MKTGTLNIDVLKNDCAVEGHEFGNSLEVLEVLNGQTIKGLLNEEQYYEMLVEQGIDIAEDGDIGGIDWDKYDYVIVANADNDGYPTEFYSFRKEWLNEIKSVS